MPDSVRGWRGPWPPECSGGRRRRRGASCAECARAPSGRSGRISSSRSTTIVRSAMFCSVKDASLPKWSLLSPSPYAPTNPACIAKMTGAAAAAGAVSRVRCSCTIATVASCGVSPYPNRTIIFRPFLHEPDLRVELRDLGTDVCPVLRQVEQAHHEREVRRPVALQLGPVKSLPWQKYFS